jgi:succinate dehydrogenase/fumarate reductase flavoprotein subunit
VPNLYAIGEVASGPDGAERIDGGPAITWCLTMGDVAGKEAAQAVKEMDWLEVDAGQLRKEQAKIDALWNRSSGIRGAEITRRVKDTMYGTCSLVKETAEMQQGLAAMQELRSEDVSRLCVSTSSRIFNKGFMEALEAENMAELSEMVIRASLMREESRGSHYRPDFPERDDAKWVKNIVIKQEDQKMTLSTVDPVMTKTTLQ